MGKVIKFLVFVTLFIVPSMSHAKVLQVFTCHGQRVNIGDTTYSVLKKCGEPAYKEVISVEGCEKVEMWHYDCKDRGYIDMLQFKAGVLGDRIRGENSSGVQDCN